MKKYLIISISAFVFLISSCYYDKEETLYPPKICNAKDSSFSISVRPILENRCYSCHSGASNGGISGVNLEGYANVKIQVDNGLLLKSIKHLPGAEPMPRNSSKLSDCEIQKITNWIEAGSPNN
jgi:uncharacterized membrane protein